MQRIDVFHEVDPRISDELIVRAAQTVFSGEEIEGSGSVSLVFVNDARLHAMNVQFLQHDYPTDVISFTLDESDEEAWGEIYISVDRAAEQAEAYRVTLQNELIRLVIHGALHLSGYDDTEPKDYEVMKEKEELYLSRIIQKEAL